MLAHRFLERKLRSLLRINRSVIYCRPAEENKRSESQLLTLENILPVIYVWDDFNVAAFTGQELWCLHRSKSTHTEMCGAYKACYSASWFSPVLAPGTSRNLYSVQGHGQTGFHRSLQSQQGVRATSRNVLSRTMRGCWEMESSVQLRFEAIFGP